MSQRTERKKNRRWERDLLTEGGMERGEVAGDDGRRWWPPERSPDYRKAETRRLETESLRLGEEMRQSPWLGRAGAFFFKTRYGHTGQPTVPVRCTPDSAQ